MILLEEWIISPVPSLSVCFRLRYFCSDFSRSICLLTSHQSPLRQPFFSNTIMSNSISNIFPSFHRNFEENRNTCLYSSCHLEWKTSVCVCSKKIFYCEIKAYNRKFGKYKRHKEKIKSTKIPLFNNTNKNNVKTLVNSPPALSNACRQSFHRKIGSYHILSLIL